LKQIWQKFYEIKNQIVDVRITIFVKHFYILHNFFFAFDNTNESLIVHGELKRTPGVDPIKLFFLRFPIFAVWFKCFVTYRKKSLIVK